MAGNIFQSAALKLTGWYLAIIMVLSIGTSFALYSFSSADLERNVNRQIGFFNGFLGPSDSESFNHLRQRQLNQDRNHLKGDLVLFNLAVLLGGGAVSYALARRTLRPIEESHEAQKRFAGDASHELRTPLTVMQSEIEVALRNPSLTKSDAVQLLHSNLEEVAKLNSLSEGLLKLTNTSAIQEDLNQAVSVKDVVKLAIERISKVSESKKIKIIDNTQALSARGNQQHLVDLVAILLDNAIKYSPKGSEVKVSSARKDKRILIAVTDQGQGIKAEDLPNIFERFYRADSARAKETTGGYGLGLALAKKIADIHEGSIEVKSAPGKGSVFTISIPTA